MLPIYAGLNRELELKAQEILRDIIGSYIEVYKDDEIDFSGLFPEEIYFARKDKCDKAVNEIYYWSRDSFKRDLSPLHEYALFKILEWAEEIEEDYKRETNKSIYFNELTKKVIDNDTDENEDCEYCGQIEPRVRSLEPASADNKATQCGRKGH